MSSKPSWVKQGDSVLKQTNKWTDGRMGGRKGKEKRKEGRKKKEISNNPVLGHSTLKTFKSQEEVKMRLGRPVGLV